jgi:enoyl-CoA hydratase/carnithine racemase
VDPHVAVGGKAPSQAGAIVEVRQGPVLQMGFDRPGRLNAITLQMYDDLSAGFARATSTPEIKVVVLHGTEDVFTAGNDVGDFLRNPPADENSPVLRFLEVLSSFTKPLIAAVNGAAVGVGTTMLLHCDLVYAGNAAQFSLPFARLGLCPEAGSSLLLQMVAGRARAAEKLLFRRIIRGGRGKGNGIDQQGVACVHGADACARKGAGACAVACGIPPAHEAAAAGAVCTAIACGHGRRGRDLQADADRACRA